MSERDDCTEAVASVIGGRTLSGLSVDEIPELERSAWTLDGYRFVFWHYFETRFGVDSARELARALSEVQEFSHIGDFLAKPDEQLDLLAAYGLILIDRLARHASAGGTGWDALHIYDGIAECSQYVQHRLLSDMMPSADSLAVARDLLRLASSRAAQARHERNNEARAFVADEWVEHAVAYNRNKSAFARDYVRRVLNEYGVRITEKTVREVWLSGTPDAGKGAGLPADG